MRRRRVAGGCVVFFSCRRRHTRLQGDWSADVCSSVLVPRHVGDDRHPGAWPNEPTGMTVVTDMPWNVTTGLGWTAWPHAMGDASIVADASASFSPEIGRASCRGRV